MCLESVKNGQVCVSCWSRVRVLSREKERERVCVCVGGGGGGGRAEGRRTDGLSAVCAGRD